MNDDAGKLQQRGSHSWADDPRCHWPRLSAAYFHIPFCFHRCGYCDFTVVASHSGLQIHYLSALFREIYYILERCDSRPALNTCYLGGGTPSQLTDEQLTTLMTTLNQAFVISDQTEVTLEANPGDLTPERLLLLRSLGVNRLSLGVQSLDNAILRFLERDHSAEHVLSLLPCCLQSFPSVSVDLICGVPGMTNQQWLSTVEALLRFPIPHISIYCLTIEPNTAFNTRLLRGSFPLIDEAQQAEHFLLADEVLCGHGYRHYEISNYALPGHECRHNHHYWQRGDYYGFGAGACGHYANLRTRNLGTVRGYISRLEQQVSPLVEYDHIASEQELAEYLMLGLRLESGLAHQDYERLTGKKLISLYDYLSKYYPVHELFVISDESLKLTPQGWLITDRLAREILAWSQRQL